MIHRKKICYILPRYDMRDASHFSHIHDFLKELGKHADIFLIIEKGEVPLPTLGYKYSPIIRGNRARRFLLTCIALVNARLKGYTDVYVHYSFMSAIIASILFRPTGGRVLYWNCGEPWKYKRSVIRNCFESLAYHLVTGLVTGAQTLGEEYAKQYRFPVDKVFVMPNWIDTGRFTRMDKNEVRGEMFLPSDVPVVLFVHRLSNRKGAHLIIPIAEKVLESYPKALFLVVGEGPLEEKLLQEVNSKKLDTHIMILGSKPNALIPQYLSASDALLMPSEEEGFPRVLLESMSLGVPFVASDVGAVSEIIPSQYAHFVLPYGDIDNFAKQLCNIFSMNDDEKRNMSTVFVNHIEQFSVSNVARRFIELFN